MCEVLCILGRGSGVLELYMYDATYVYMDLCVVGF